MAPRHRASRRVKSASLRDDNPGMTAAHPPGPGILADLRTATWPLHRSLEARLDLMSPTLDTKRYGAVLAGMLAFYGPCEAALFAVPGLADLVPALARRRKTHWLAADLAALAGAGYAVARADHGALRAPAIDDLPAALGCLYVFEGATLGGRIISAHLQDCLGIGPHNGGAFFHAYGGRGGRMWRGMQAALRAGATGPAAAAAMVDSAYAVFASMDAWFASLAAGPDCSGSRFTQATLLPRSV